MNDGNELNPAVRRPRLVRHRNGRLVPDPRCTWPWESDSRAVGSSPYSWASQLPWPEQIPHSSDKQDEGVHRYRAQVAAALLLPPPLAGLTAALPTAIHEIRRRVSSEEGACKWRRPRHTSSRKRWSSLAGESNASLSDVRNCVAVAIALIVMRLSTMAVAGVVALQLDRAPIQVWREGIWIDLPEHIVLVANGVLFAAIGGSYPWLLPLFVGPLVLVYLSLSRSANLRQVSQATIEAIADLTDLLAGGVPAMPAVWQTSRTAALQLGVPGEADIATRRAASPWKSESSGRIRS